MKTTASRALTFILTICALIIMVDRPFSAQEQTSGTGSAVTISAPLPAGSNVIGKTSIDQTTPGTTNLVSIGSNGTVGLNAGAAIVGKMGIDQTTPGTTNGVQVNAALPAGANSIGTVVNGPGTNNIGFVRVLPSPCPQSTNFTLSTVGVATGAGTSITSTTTCITKLFVNNTTNSPVTFRFQDKTGTPIIWIGGNADFTLPANSNVSFPLEGVTMTGGITAIAGTAAALNVQVSGVQ